MALIAVPFLLAKTPPLPSEALCLPGELMPPRTRKGLIVQSGNAGNSSKVSKAQKDKIVEEQSAETKDKPLFPPGSKYPLSLLNERSVMSQMISRK